MSSTFRLNRTSNGVSVNRTLNTLGVVSQPSQGPRGADSGLTYAHYGTLAALGERPADQTTVTVRGYAEPGDGGGGAFYYEQDSTRTPDGGTVLPGTQGTDVWVRIWSGRRDVRWFGVRGTAGGATLVPGNDDGDALRACLNAGDGDVWMPEGRFPVLAPVTKPSGVNIWGAGKQRTTIDGSQLSGTVLDTSVPGITAGVSCVIWSAGSVTEIPGFAGARKGDNVIVVADTSMLAKGDVLLFSNETDYSFSLSRSYYRDGNFAIVHNLNNATDIRLARPLPTSYDTADDIHVWKVTPTFGTINDVTVIAKSFVSGIHIKFGYRQTHLRVDATGSDTHNGWLDRCYRCGLVECSVQDQSDVGAAEGATGGTNYGWLIGNSQDIKVIGGAFETGRHGITTGGDTGKLAVPCRDILVDGATVSGQRDTSFNTIYTPVLPPLTLTTSTVTTGNATRNEVQRINLRSGDTHVTAGVWVFAFDGAYTEPVAFNATLAQFQAALEALPTIGVGNVAVAVRAGESGTTLDTAVMDVTFLGLLGHLNVDPIAVASQVGVTRITAGVAGIHEVQVLDVRSVGIGGTFTLTMAGQTTRAIGGNAVSAMVQDALEAALGADTVTVLGGPGSTGLAVTDIGALVIIPKGPFAYQNLAPITGTASVGSVLNLSRVYTVDARAAGGSWTLRFNGVTSANINVAANAATVKSALEAMSSIGAGNVVVMGGPSNTGLLTVALAGTLSGTAQSLTSPTAGVSLTPLNVDGAAGVNEVQRIDARAVGATATWQAIVAGQYSGPLAGNANAATIQAALQLLPSVGAGGALVTVTAGDAGTTADVVRFDVTFSGPLASTDVPLMEGGIGRTQTPFGASNHGNIDTMTWANCTFPAGLSTGGRNVAIVNCNGAANSESGIAILFGEMVSPALTIDGGIWRATSNISTGNGLITLTMPTSCLETGTATIRNVDLQMGSFVASSGTYTAAIAVNNDATDPYGSHVPITPVAQQPMNLALSNVTVDGSYPALTPAYALYVYGLSTVPGKGLKTITVDRLTCTGIGGLVVAYNDPETLLVTNPTIIDAPEYGCRLIPLATGKYATPYVEFHGGVIRRAQYAGLFLQGAATTTTGARAKVAGMTIIDCAKTIQAASSSYNGAIYARGYTDFVYEHNTVGMPEGSPGATARADTLDYITNLYESHNTTIGSVIAENRGVSLAFTNWYLRKRAAGVPTQAASSGSMYQRTDGGTGTSFYVREGTVWVPK